MISACKTLVAALSLCVLAAPTFADSHGGDFKGQIKARKAVMTLYGASLGPLGAMAKGDMAYDAEAATKAASNLVALTTLDQSTYWPQGSDNASVEGTRTLPALWEDFPGVMKHLTTLSEASLALQEAAGKDLDSLRAALGPVGGACGACHKAYRAQE